MYGTKLSFTQKTREAPKKPKGNNTDSLLYKTQTLLSLYQIKHGHNNLIVCHTNERWTLVRHVSNMQSYVFDLKNIIFWLGHAPDMAKQGLDIILTRLGHNQDMA